MSRAYQNIGLLAFVLSVSVIKAQAQKPIHGEKQLEFSSGLVLPSLESGSRLLSLKSNRDQGRGYLGANAGEYSAQQGYALNLGYHKPLKAIKGLLLGGKVLSSQTGSTPEIGGYAEAYYFNFLLAGPSIKYYPLENQNLLITGQFGLGSVFTKSRFVEPISGIQNYNHDFGIGAGGGIGIGYTFTPFKNKTYGIELLASYHLYSTRVEVYPKGDDIWRFNALSITAGIIF